jgi:hypothetical protein
MSAKNVKTLRVAHESWNKRDFAGVVSNAVKGLAYTDHGRNLTLNTRDTFRKWTKGWAKAFSDGRIINPQYIDAGDIVVAQVHRRRHQRRTIGVTEADRSQDVSALLRNLPL